MSETLTIVLFCFFLLSTWS